MYLDENGQKWFKGNLHTHSTRSDGRRTPDEVFALYRSQGYDFMALTDHWKLSETEMQSNGLLTLRGCEYHSGEHIPGIYHIVGIGMTETPNLPAVTPDTAPQPVIDEINRCGGIAILAHPAWSMETVDMIEPLQGLAGTEIYNTVSGAPWNCRPYSGIVIDQLAARGKLLPCMAADDAHFYNGDACRSYLMVHAEACTPDALLDALRRGDFYATQGPRLACTVVGGELHVKCSPVRQITFFNNLAWDNNRNTCGSDLTEAVYPIPAAATFVRVEALDADGRTAWSSPIAVNGASK